MHTIDIARLSRVRALQMVNRAKSSHIGSSLSCIDILSVLYSRINPNQSLDAQEHVVLVSKGHAAAGVYSVMYSVGLIPLYQVSTYCMDGATLSGHVTAGPFVEFSTGSLGHALPYAVGRALAAKRKGLKTQIYVLISDGECNEGSNWEAALIASHLELDNLKVIIDRNFLQSLKSTEETIRLEPLADKWKAFGWNVENLDGHDHKAIEAFLNTKSTSPSVAIARTIKGYGVSFMENSIEWHYRFPNDLELIQAIEEIERNA
jgi:transketolase